MPGVADDGSITGLAREDVSRINQLVSIAAGHMAECMPGARKLLLTLTREGAPDNAPPDITLQPAYEWLLAGPSADTQNARTLKFTSHGFEDE